MAAAILEQAWCSPSGGIYDVFTSFRYEDIGKTFADHLHSALHHSEFRIFGDKHGIERGENIDFEVENAIKESRMSIIIFSKGYASSSQCLDELAMILQHKKTSSNHHHILPIFYDVNPSDVSKQTGSFKEAFQSYEEGERKKEWKSKVDGWKTALREAADLAGMDVKSEANGHEAKFIERLIEIVRDKLRGKFLSMPPYPVGVVSRATFINSWLNDGSSEVGMLAICGMGGLGKTTIAKFVYNSNWLRFQASSFLENMAEISKQQNGIISLQMQLLSDIVKVSNERINSVAEGTVKIQDALKCKKVLLVLDDVDNPKQIEEVVGICDWLHPGSKIMVTTRDEQLVRAQKVCEVQRLEILNRDESLKLFSWHAFRQSKPDECFKEITEKLVNCCGGLPLAIKILGSSLSGRSLSVWESQLEKLMAIPNCKILERLRISFDLLDDHDKDLFLHMACFFVGKDKDFVAPIFDGCGFHTIVGFQNLIDKCLLTIECNELKMHNLLQEMGKEIVCQESPKNPGKRSRIWHRSDSLNILIDKTGTENIEGLLLNMKDSNSTILDYSTKKALETNAFSAMRQLKLLVLNYVQLSGSYVKFPKGLRWLCWHGYPLYSIPSHFFMDKIVILEMPYSKLRYLWSGTKSLTFLKVLNLSNSYDLKKTPDFSLVSNLEKLILENCTSMVKIHKSIGLLKKLVLLNLRNCAKLIKLPKGVGELKSLETLDIHGCSNLKKWPAELENMESLTVLEADRVGKVKARDSFIWPWSLKPNKIFKISFTCLPQSLVKLSLVACDLWDDAFPTDVSNLSSLTYLNLSENPICNFPGCFTRLTRLGELQLKSCRQLRSIAKLPTKSLDELNVDGCLFLEKITCMSRPTKHLVICKTGCGRLVELLDYFKIEPIGNADMEIVNNLNLSNWNSLGTTNVKLRQTYSAREAWTIPLQVCHSFRREGLGCLLPYVEDKEFDIFTTYLQRSEVPVWCNFRKRGFSIDLVVPFYGSNTKIRGLNVCSIYALCNIVDINIEFEYVYVTRVNNMSTGASWNNLDKYVIGVPETNQDMMELSYWKFKDDELKSGDKLRVEIDGLNISGKKRIKVKEIGVCILYEEEEERSIQSANNQEIQVTSEMRLLGAIYNHHNYKIRLNTHTSTFNGYCGVFRACDGKWILGYYGNRKYVKSPFYLTYWAVYQGFQVMLEKGWSNVLVQIDNWSAVELLQSITRATSTSESMKIRDFIFLRSWCNCSFSYILPERNKLAQSMIKLAKHKYEKLVVLEEPPDDPHIKSILLAEMKMKSTA